MQQELPRVAKPMALHARDVLALLPPLLLAPDSVPRAEREHAIHEREERRLGIRVDDGRPIVVARCEDPAWSQDALHLRQRALGLHVMERLRARDDVRRARGNARRLGHAGAEADVRRAVILFRDPTHLVERLDADHLAGAVSPERRGESRPAAEIHDEPRTLRAREAQEHVGERRRRLRAARVVARGEAGPPVSGQLRVGERVVSLAPRRLLCVHVRPLPRARLERRLRREQRPRAPLARDRHGHERLDPAGMAREHAAAVAEEDRLLDVVGDEQDRLLRRLRDLVELLAERDARLRIDGRERLVHQHHFGIRGERARDGHALLHAAGELVRILLLEADEAHHLDVAAHGLLALGLRDALDLEPVRDVPIDGAPRQDREFLEDDPAIRAGPFHRPAVEQHVPTRGRDEAGDDREQRALAAPARPDDGEQLALRDVEVDAVERHDPLAGIGVDVLADARARYSRTLRAAARAREPLAAGRTSRPPGGVGGLGGARSPPCHWKN